MGAGIVPLISLGVDAVVGVTKDILERSQKDLNGKFLASGVYNLSFFSLQPGQLTKIAKDGNLPENKLLYQDGWTLDSCLLVVRGYFGVTEKGAAGSDPSRLTQVDLSNMKVKFFPDFYAEFSISSKWNYKYAAVKDDKGKTIDFDWSISDGSISVKPQFLSYGDTSANRRGTGSKTVAVTIGVSPNIVSENQESESIIRVPLNLGTRQLGRFYREKNDSQFAGIELSVPIPEFMRSYLKPEKSFAKGNFNVQSLVIETEDPTIAEAAMISAFKKNEADLAKALKDYVISILGSGQKKE
jgi:hypothetical protein